MFTVFLGVWIALGVILIFSIVFGKSSKPRDLGDANELLRERNAIGRKQLDELGQIGLALRVIAVRKPSREQLAMNSMHGMLASMQTTETESAIIVAKHGGMDEFAKALASASFIYADAQIAAGREGV